MTRHLRSIEEKRGKQLTKAVCVRNNNVSCPKLDEKLLHKFQWRIDTYSQRSLHDARDTDEQKCRKGVHGGTMYLVHVHTEVEWILSAVSAVNNRRYG